MKTIFCSLFALAVLLVAARADLTIVQQVDGVGPVAQMTMKIKGDKARIEASPEVTMIFDGKTGESLTIMHGQKMVVRTSAAQAKTAMAAMAGNGGQAQGARPKVIVTPSGRKETINGYETEEFVADGGAYKASYWVAKSYPLGDAILKQLQAMTPEAWSAGAMATPDFRDFPGLPIRTNVTMGETKVVSTITSVTMDPLPETDFGVPQGYGEMKMPDLSSMEGAKKEAPKAAKPSPSRKR